MKTGHPIRIAVSGCLLAEYALACCPDQFPGTLFDSRSRSLINCTGRAFS